MRLNGLAAILALMVLAAGILPAQAQMVEHPVVRLQSLDKATARTMTFEVRVGSTVKFGPIYIKVQACRKAPPMEAPEAASFLQIWEVTPKGESKWVFSGWMFASSPALSPMEHPIYDVWVLDCLERKSTDPVPAPAPSASGAATAEDQSGDGEVTGAAAEPPADAPAIQTGPRVDLPGSDSNDNEDSPPNVTLPPAQ